MWKASDELVRAVYRATTDFPKNEIYGLTSQLRRASLSVVLNIVEGYARRSSGDLRRFLDISLGSLAETEYLLELCNELGYLSERDFGSLNEMRSVCGRLIWSYRAKITRR